MSAPIRPARPADLELLVAMISEFYAESGYPLDASQARDAMEELCSDAALGRLWLITEAAEPVGYIAVTFGLSLEYQGRDAFIDDLHIRRAFRAGASAAACWRSSSESVASSAFAPCTSATIQAALSGSRSELSCRY